MGGPHIFDMMCRENKLQPHHLHSSLRFWLWEEPHHGLLSSRYQGTGVAALGWADEFLWLSCLQLRMGPSSSLFCRPPGQAGDSLTRSASRPASSSKYTGWNMWWAPLMSKSCRNRSISSFWECGGWLKPIVLSFSWLSEKIRKV